MTPPDDPRRPPTLASGVPARAPDASRAASARLPPRDTETAVRDAILALEREVERLGDRVTGIVERIEVRLGNGAEAMTRLDVRLDAAERAAAARPVPWLRVIPIALVLAGMGATALLATARKVDAERFEVYAERADARERALLERTATIERELAAARAQTTTLQAVTAAIDQAIKREARGAPRRTP